MCREYLVGRYGPCVCVSVRGAAAVLACARRLEDAWGAALAAAAPLSLAVGVARVAYVTQTIHHSYILSKDRDREGN